MTAPAARLAGVTTETDLTLADGRNLHVYDTGEQGGTRLAVFWHHGTPNTGAPPEPLFPASGRLGIRWVSYDRPAYCTSTPRPGRDIASAAEDVRSIADALGIARFAVMGHSGGATHALASGALLPERAVATVSVATLAPFGADGLDWFAGMAPSIEANLRAAAGGRAALEKHRETADFDPEMFTDADQAALEGSWSWLAGVAGQAIEGGPDGQVDDDLAYTAAWGFDPAQVTGPVLFLHGGQDRISPSSHGEWLAGRCPSAQLRLYRQDGHISVLESAAPALDWLVEQADRA
jgi:pimeloyl-ACP methyl ester carboxylesterase